MWGCCGGGGGSGVGVVGKVWADIRVVVVLRKEGVGRALPSSDMYNDLVLSAKPIILPFTNTYSRPLSFLDPSAA